MSNEAPFDQHSPDALEAVARLADVIPMCSDEWHCHRTKCKRCREREAWQNAITQADQEFHMNVFGELD